MSALADLTAAEIADDVRAGRRSAVVLAKDALAQIVARDGALNCFTRSLRDRALETAERVDQAVAEGRDPGPLAGTPFAVKNQFDIEGVVTLAGSVIDAERPAASADATVIQRMEAAGAVLIGALNMDEYAYGSTNENSHYGPTRNPHDLGRITGGSSGGSAAAVAAGLTPISLGTDANGAIRVPAALCGVFGLKPTFGRLSRLGVRPFVNSLDHVGPIARTTRDLALAYDALQGHDPRDPASAHRPIEPVLAEIDQPPPRVRVGMLYGWFRESAHVEALGALEAVASRLHARRADLPGAKAARAAAFCMTAAEGSSLHLADLRRQPENFDPATRDRLIAGAMQPAHVLAKAQRVRRWFLREVMALFENFDLLLAPTTPIAATPIGQVSAKLGNTEVAVRAHLGLYAQPFSFVGVPVLSAPVVRKGALPVGVQLIAPPWREDLLFSVAAWLEREGVTRARAPGSLPMATASA